MPISTPPGRKKGAQDQAIGRSRGGLSTKIHLAIRGLGCPVRIHLTAGHRGDCPQAHGLIEGLPARVVMADTAYDADPLPKRSPTKVRLPSFPTTRRVATRYEKTAQNYLAVITLAATIFWLR